MVQNFLPNEESQFSGSLEGLAKIQNYFIGLTNKEAWIIF